MNKLNVNINVQDLIRAIEEHQKFQENGKGLEWYSYMISNTRYQKPILRGKDVHDHIREKINLSMPYLAGRIGNTEANIIGEFLEKKAGLRQAYSREWKKWLLSTSGFFCSSAEDEENDIDKFAELQLKAVEACDTLMVWGAPQYEDYIVKNYASKNVVFTLYGSINPFRRDFRSWTAGLEGKRVLVISSFEESIKKQWERKEEISRWENSKLPDFELKTYQMIQTQCGNKCGFSSWFEAFDKINEDVMSIDFDVAIVGAGAYGLPLSANIKRVGKCVIELCGLTPFMFGIVGQRHIDQGMLAEFGTDAWIRPVEEKPEWYKNIEGGCYW